MTTPYETTRSALRKFRDECSAIRKEGRTTMPTTDYMTAKGWVEIRQKKDYCGGWVLDVFCWRHITNSGDVISRWRAV
jgi:hypothetical protein